MKNRTKINKKRVKLSYRKCLGKKDGVSVVGNVVKNQKYNKCIKSCMTYKKEDINQGLMFMQEYI